MEPPPPHQRQGCEVGGIPNRKDETVSKPTYRVVAVDLKSHERRTLTAGKDKANAEAYADMAVLRRGCEKEMFCVEEDAQPAQRDME